MCYEYVKLYVICCEVVWFKDCFVLEILEMDNCFNFCFLLILVLFFVRLRIIIKMDIINIKCFFDNFIICIIFGFYNFLVFVLLIILIGILFYFLYYYCY